MSKNVVLTLEPRFMDEYGEYAKLPVFNAHGSIVGYVGGEVPESGNPCEFNRLGDEGFTYCASATEVVSLKAENAKLRDAMYTNAGKHAFDEFPEKILVLKNGTRMICLYVPERTAKRVSIPRQSHVALGHYECGGCGALIEQRDRFCRDCGARLEDW